MINSDTYDANISCNLACVICLSGWSASMIDLCCRQVTIHGPPLSGLFSTDWPLLAQATNLQSVDQGHTILKLIAVNECLK